VPDADERLQDAPHLLAGQLLADRPLRWPGSGRSLLIDLLWPHQPPPSSFACHGSSGNFAVRAAPRRSHAGKNIHGAPRPKKSEISGPKTWFFCRALRRPAGRGGRRWRSRRGPEPRKKRPGFRAFSGGVRRSRRSGGPGVYCQQAAWQSGDAQPNSADAARSGAYARIRSLRPASTSF